MRQSKQFIFDLGVGCQELCESVSGPVVRYICEQLKDDSVSWLTIDLHGQMGGHYGEKAAIRIRP